MYKSRIVTSQGTMKNEAAKRSVRASQFERALTRGPTNATSHLCTYLPNLLEDAVVAAVVLHASRLRNVSSNLSIYVFFAYLDRASEPAHPHEDGPILANSPL